MPTDLYTFVRWWADREGKSLNEVGDMLGYSSAAAIYRWKSHPIQADRMASVLAALGYKTDEVLTLVSLLSPEESRDPYADAVRKAVEEAEETETKRKPRTPVALKSGERGSGLHSKAIIGNGQLYGVNPRA
ncbi:hypothetical protein AB0C33_02030 [Nonomuraea sp. NPDC048881]|uniref:hypothetical protein n=1 Tax=Nonomuraea sp. NPDC048881 TaxID=3155030 RepID=UPI0033CF1C15